MGSIITLKPKVARFLINMENKYYPRLEVTLDTDLLYNTHLDTYQRLQQNVYDPKHKIIGFKKVKPFILPEL